MKRFIAIICTMFFLLSLMGCSAEKAEPQTENNGSYQGGASKPPVQPATTQTTPTEVPLSTENITEYLIFTTKTEDVKVESVGYKNLEKGEGKLIVKTSPKKNVEFSDVTLTVSLVTSPSYGWGTLNNRQIEIPFNGTTENTFSIFSKIEEYVSDSPTFKVEVTAVTGSVTLK